MPETPAPQDVRTVTCVGAGVIGGGWVAYFLARGYDVVAWDPAPDAEQRLRHLVDSAWPALRELGLAGGAGPTPRAGTGCGWRTTWPRRWPRQTSSRRAPRRTWG